MSDYRTSRVGDYNKYILQKIIFLIVVFLLVVALSFVSVSVGYADLSVSDVVKSLFFGSDEFDNTIIWDIRLPRVALALVAGAALATAGAVMQSILNNPLASPYTLGLSSASTFGAAFAIVFLGGGVISSGTVVMTLTNPALVTFCAFIGAMGCTAIIILISYRTRVSPEAMLLAGVAIGAMFSAGVSALQYFSESVQLSAIVYWTFGDLGKATWKSVLTVTVVLVPTFVYYMFNRWNYNAMETGEDTAASLGINVANKRIAGMFFASLTTATVVSLVGIIGFVGLLGPHIVRRIIGSDNRFLIPGSALVGGLILLSADTVARVIVQPYVFPVGVITSFLGAPLFIYLLLKSYGRRTRR